MSPRFLEEIVMFTLGVLSCVFMLGASSYVNSTARGTEELAASLLFVFLDPLLS